jgi:DNA polymerase III alpha subunit
LFPCAAEERLAAGTPPRPPPVISCRDLARFTGGRVALRGWTAATRRALTEAGEWMRFLTLEDESGLAEVVLFPPIYRRDGHLLGSCGPHLVSGVVEDHFGAATLRAERVW